MIFRYADESLKRMTSFLDNRLREAAEKNNEDYNSSRRSYHADSHQENGGDTRYNRYSTGSRYESAVSSGGGSGAGHQSRFESSNSSGSRYESGASRLDSAISRYNSSSVSRFEPSASNQRYDSTSSGNGTATSRFESGGSSGSRFESGVSRFDAGGSSRFQSSKMGMGALGRTSNAFYKGKR